MDENKKPHIIWWNELEESERIQIEKDFGYYGHDIGLNDDDILYFYLKK